MNLEIEKDALINQVEKINDIRLFRAVKSILDYGLNKEDDLETSSKTAI